MQTCRTVGHPRRKYLKQRRHGSCIGGGHEDAYDLSSMPWPRVGPFLYSVCRCGVYGL